MSKTLECKLHVGVPHAEEEPALGPKQEQPMMHIVMVPYPLQGQINPMMQFAKALIAKHSVKVSFINIKHHHDRMQKARSLSSAHDSMIASSRRHVQSRDELQERLEFLWVDNGLPNDFDYTDIRAKIRDFHFATLNMKGPLKQILERLNQKSPSISCVMFGSFCSWVHTISAELGIPSVFFWSQSMAVLSIYYHAPLLDANGLFPYKKHATSDPAVEQEVSHDTCKLVSYLPGVPPLHPSDIPTLLHVDGLSDPVYVMLREHLSVLQNCQGIIINSFEELERDAYQVIQKELPFPVTLAGPLIPSAFLEGDVSDASVGASLLEENIECIDWLNHQRKQSVLYVSFGSLLNPSPEDLATIANGIKNSEQPFLWVIRPRSSIRNVASILPEGFMDDTKELGLIIPWAPQLQVLSHPSVGAFLTHCGWNSTLEALSMGVPMICCPLFTDQPTNSAYMCKFWKIGIALKRHVDDSLRILDVERVVKTVLLEKEGEEMRKRAVELREDAKRAIRAQGSSCIHMEEFIQTVRSHRNGK
ncbi:hypothetical protein GOP47_0022156 [Adiantum capillus-veneris]|uniref:Glycosyltransferase n=1 Tax=Adiantum capillus-veneris TaxID=13818 RepID=A0A9D4Z6V0_ADICA|nr:hypothetical protein GOP47_0022156 [Adiantum capillus-veneris]